MATKAIPILHRQSKREKRAAERLREHRFAVIHLARYRAKKAVEAELKSKGVRVTLVRPAEIRLLAEDYLAQHRERLCAEAEQAINTSPLFAYLRCAQLKTNAQSKNEPKSTTSVVQNSCAE